MTPSDPIRDAGAPSPGARGGGAGSAGPALRVRGASKEYPSVVALNNADLELHPGEVHLLLGQNGAGKSTLIGILEGNIRPDSGGIEVAGEPASLGDATDAHALGIHSVRQTPAVVPRLSVAENLFLGERLPHLAPGVVSRRELHRLARERLRRFSSIDVTRPLSEYSVATHTLVALARAFAGSPRVVLLDEPTASLSDRETKRLFSVVGQLHREGAAILFTTHRLEEAMEVGDRVTVLKDGAVTLSAPMKDLTKDDLVAAIVGDVDPAAAGQPRSPVAAVAKAGSERALRVEGLSGGRIQGASLTVGKGEVVGIAGLVGSGRSTLAHLIFGSQRSDGRVWVGDRELPKRRGPRLSLREGLILAPEDRREQALFMTRTVRANLTVASRRLNRAIRWLPFPSVRRERAFVERAAADTDLRRGLSERAVATLSGGNQQKVVLGRWVEHRCEVFLLDEPTVGIDVGAKLEVARLMRRLADQGAGVLFISSDLSEVAEWADRVLVMRDGRITAEVQTPTDEEHLIKHCYGEVES
jgi:ABC-type sugar transport system ATPase subunit